MQVIYYDRPHLLPFYGRVVNDWRDDVCSYRFTGPNWQVWFVPGTIDPND